MRRYFEEQLERSLFASRWLLAPFYLGLVLSLVMLLIVFFHHLVRMIPTIPRMEVEDAILGALSLIDLSLAANLIIIVILAGYESFVSRIDTAAHSDRPSWMGSVGFAGLKLKLYASIVAISGIQLLKVFTSLGRGLAIDRDQLMWLVAIHLTFVLTSVLSTLGDWLSALAKRAQG